MRLALLAVSMALVVGCASSTITVYRKGEQTPAATIEQTFSGRGCIAVDSTPSGKTSVLVQQDGTSDWSTSRLLAFLGDIAGAVFGSGEHGAGMQGPTAAYGCTGVLADEPTPEPP